VKSLFKDSSVKGECERWSSQQLKLMQKSQYEAADEYYTPHEEGKSPGV
jgi:hypothetical protein